MTSPVTSDPILSAVYVRPSATADWQLVPDLYVRHCRFCVAPEIPSASLMRYYGVIEDTGDLDNPGPQAVYPAGHPSGEFTPANGFPYGLRGCRVKIVLTQGELTHVWQGLVIDQEDLPGGGDVSLGELGTVPTGRQVFECRGYEYLLTKFSLQHARCAAKTGYLAALINTPIPFNSRDRRGLLDGNRSSAKDGTAGTYLFSDTDYQVWTAYDVLEYLLGLFAMPAVGDFAFTLGNQDDSYDFLTEAAAALAFNVDVWDFNGLTYHECLCRLLTPSRGFSWLVICDGDDQPLICPVSAADADVKDGSDNTIIPANPRTLTSDLDTSAYVRQPTIRALDDAWYHQVHVIGDPLRVAFTLGFAGEAYRGYSALEIGWTVGEQTAYDLLDDDAIAKVKHEHIYSAFRVAAAWDGSVHGDNADIALPVIDEDDCTIIKDTRVDNFHRNSLVLDRTLPWPQSDGSERPPLVLCNDTAGENKLYRVDRPHPLELAPAHVRILDTDLGFAIHGQYPHLYGNNYYAGPSASLPQADYHDLLATVALRTQERCRCLMPTGRTLEAGELTRVKTISIQGLGIDYALPNTIKDFDGDSVDVVSAGGELVRNDGPKLVALARLAAAFYGRCRYQVAVDYNCGQLRPFLGWLMTDVKYNGVTITAGTMVSRVEYSLLGDNQSARWATEWSDVDWQGLLVGRGTSPERQRLQQVEDRVAALPVSPAIGGAGGGTTVLAKVTSKVSDNVYLCSLYAAGYAETATVTGVTVKIPQIATGATIPVNTWLLVVKAGDHYEGQVPVWL